MITERFRGLLGADLVVEGLRDLTAGRETPESLLVEIGAPKLRQLGVAVPSGVALPEHRLYALLARSSSDDAHSRYNALLRRLVSFERALACASSASIRREVAEVVTAATDSGTSGPLDPDEECRPRDPDK